MSNSQKGFTLIEVLIAMVIIGLAAGSTATLIKQDTQSIRQELFIKSIAEIQDQLNLSIKSKDKKNYNRSTNLLSLDRPVWQSQMIHSSKIEDLTEYCVTHKYFLTETSRRAYATLTGCYYE